MMNLEPKNLWKQFHNICQIPHPSKKEEKLRKYIKDFAKLNNLECREDGAGNIVIVKPAAKNYENKAGVVLQSHIDMVCEKDESYTHNFDKDPIKYVIEEGWVKATHTTLGADNGIGVATMLAILEDNSLNHGEIEALFTVDEETGLNGALALSNDFIKNKTIINLDTEDEGVLYVGCAGGQTTILSKKITLSDYKIPLEEVAIELKINHLIGGHSGMMINSGLANSIKILSFVLKDLSLDFDFHLTTISGGEKHNVIPREAVADIVIKKCDIIAIKKKLAFYVEQYKKIFVKEENLDLSIKELKNKKIAVMKDCEKNSFINILNSLPHGVITNSCQYADTVESSTNLASVKLNDSTITILTSQRSLMDFLNKVNSESIISIGKLWSMKSTIGSKYPAWQPDYQSKILKLSTENYKKLFHKEAQVKTIHAGLECGIISSKYPNSDFISIGPTIKAVHTPGEKVDIESVKKYWKFIIALLEKV